MRVNIRRGIIHIPYWTEILDQGAEATPLRPPQSSVVWPRVILCRGVVSCKFVRALDVPTLIYRLRADHLARSERGVIQRSLCHGQFIFVHTSTSVLEFELLTNSRACHSLGRRGTPYAPVTRRSMEDHTLTVMPKSKRKRKAGRTVFWPVEAAAKGHDGAHQAYPRPHQPGV
jgi:hypothetical protein